MEYHIQQLSGHTPAFNSRAQASICSRLWNTIVPVGQEGSVSAVGVIVVVMVVLAESARADGTPSYELSNQP
jgi:hypothetical protein